MLQKKYFTFENLMFYGLLILSIINIWSVNIYVTNDGPSHLYNAGLLNLMDGNSFLNEFYKKNDLFLPNYFSHIVLSNLFLVFDPFTSEKIFLSLFVLFLPLTFRYALKLYTKNTRYSFLIFPLVFSFLFQFGFFNFCVAFVFLNCQLILLYFILQDNKKWHHLLLFVFNSIVLYHAHPFVFCVSILIIGLLTIFYYAPDVKVILKKGLFLLLLLLPALTLFFIFYFKYQIPDYDYPTTEADKFNKILIFSPGISYSTNEGINAGVIAILIYFLMSAVIMTRFFYKKAEKIISYSDAFLFFAIILIPFIIYTNSGWLSGMLTDRLVYIFFYIIVFWIALNALEFKVIYYISVLIVVLTFHFQSHNRSKALNDLSGQAESIAASSKYVRENSTVFSVNYSDNWLAGNFSNYCGINKSIINMNNYEAILGWFPLKWNKKNRESVNWNIDSTDKITQLPDYILFYGDMAKLNNVENEKLKQFIQLNSVKRFQSANKYCNLYEVKLKR
jgi:hypothetical protein